VSKTLSGAPVVPDVWWIRVYAASGKVQFGTERGSFLGEKELCLRGERQASKVPECGYFTWRDTRGIELLGDEPVTADVQWSGSMRQGRAAMVLVMRKQ
jgi:hypothetical protein